MRMIGAGGIVSVQIGDAAPKTILFEKTAGPSKGKMAQASGLADANPLQVLWTEIVEETGIVLVDRANQTLSLVVLEPKEDRDPAFENHAEQREFFDTLEQEKRKQFDTIREQLPEDIKNWDIQTVRKQVSLSPEEDYYMDFVSVNLPGRSQPLQTRAIVSDSERTANVNLLRPVRLELPERTETLFLDGENFKRPVQSFEREELLTEHFIENKASVPMKPYLQKVAKAENLTL